MAYPSDLVRTKDWGTEILTDADLEGQYDVIIAWLDAFADETTGHKHDATSNEGPQIALAGGNQGVTGTLAVANGGTGLSTITDGGILLGSGTNAITAMGVLADGSIVVGDGTTDPVALAAFTSSTGLLKHERGGIETDISAIAKGGLLVGTATGTIGIKAVGSDGLFLQAASGETGGVKWSPLGSGYEFIASGTFSNSSSVSIAETMSDGDSYLLIAEGYASADAALRLTVNNDESGTDYSYAFYENFGSVASSANADGVLGSTSNMTENWYLETYINVRNSDVMFNYKINNKIAADTSHLIVVGTGLYEAGTPTSIQIKEHNGNARLTGRYYLFKLLTS